MLAGTETNVLPDGALDYEDDLLEQLDWVVASVHTSFRMREREMTERMVAAHGAPAGRRDRPSHRTADRPPRALRASTWTG